MSSLTPTKIAFLLGSGVSIPAEMPSTEDITEKVLSGEGIYHWPDSTYRFAEPSNKDEHVLRVVEFLNILKFDIDRYYQYNPERLTNYEDLYYMAAQIEDSESGNFDNPAVQPLIDKIFPEIKRILIGNKFRREEWRLIDLAHEATNYIEDVVRCLLFREPKSTEYLESLKDACLDRQFSKIDIFTLNHDKVLEEFFSKNGIQFTDGFDEPVNDVRYWNPDLFETSCSKVRLFKLHGSVNWFRFRPDGGDWSNESIGIPLSKDIWYTKNPQGQMQLPVDGRPILLLGTFNKMLEYTSGIYTFLHCQFYHSLANTNRLVVCGYGFGDKGINNRIIEWIRLSSNRRILIIHPNPEELKKSARVAIRNNWNEWIKQKKLTIIPKKIEETSWKDIRDELFKIE